MISQDLNPDIVLKALRDTTPYKHQMVEIYTYGGCYKLYLLLKLIFPEAEAYFRKDRNHVVTKIGDCFYDINGKVKLKYLYDEKWNNLKLTNKDHKECKKWFFM